MKTWVILVLVMWPFVARADNDCDNDHYMRAFDPALGRMACKELSVQRTYNPDPHHLDQHALLKFDETHPAKILHPGSAIHETAEEHTAIDELGEIATRTAAAAASVRMPLPDKVTFLLDPNAIPAEHRASQLAELKSARDEHFARDGECVVAYHYRSTDPRKKFIVVHQLFHCMVMKTWEDARLSSGDADWWAEGSAEFFASIAYPGGMTDVDAQAFHANETASLFSRSHDAVVFFDWYATAPGRLKGLLETVNDKPAGALLVDLQEDVGAHWVEFEEAYFDHTIRSPGGAIVSYPSTPAPDTQRITGSTTKNFTATPYVIRGAILEFAEGHAYDLDGGAEDDFKWKWSQGDAGTWVSMPTVVHTCHQTQRYRIVLAAKNREVTKRLRVTARDEHEADCPCLVGGWQQTGPSLARVPARLQARGIHNAQCQLVGGGTLLQFTADHNGGETYQDLHTTCTSQTTSSDGVSHGTRSFTWTLDSPTQVTMSSAGGDASSHVKVTVHGRTVEQDAPMTGAGVGVVTFRCTRSDLHLEFHGATTDAFDYTRVGAHP